MQLAISTGDAFVVLLATLGFVPAVRAYAAERAAPWVVAAYAALLVGRLAAAYVPESATMERTLFVHGVGVVAVAAFVGLHFYAELRTGEAGDDPVDRRLDAAGDRGE
ncbi:MAG: hypothetical protein ABEJ31_02680 [Haloarculaceae archaeon]